MMAETSGGGGFADKINSSLGIGSAPPAAEAKKGADPMKKLNATLSSLTSAITSLPGNIESATFVVKPYDG